MVSKKLVLRESANGGRRLTAAATLFVLLQASGAVAEQSPADLTVREEKGIYTVVARFLVDQSPDVAFNVLADYEQIPRFMPNVRTSIVRERGPGWAVVEQEAVSALMMFSKRVHLVLEIVEQPDALIFRDRCARSFVRYEGAWRLSHHDGQTAITYELTAEPSFDVPGWMLKLLLRRDSAQMIEGLRREIAARATPDIGLLQPSRLPSRAIMSLPRATDSSRALAVLGPVNPGRTLPTHRSVQSSTAAHEAIVQSVLR
jgi:ribosome-associated toxin RatA of RatAB toxin-antitoxin module